MRNAVLLMLVGALLVGLATPAPAGIPVDKARGGVVAELSAFGNLVSTGWFSFIAQGDRSEAKGNLNWKIRGEDGFEARIQADVDCYEQLGNRGYITGVFTTVDATLEPGPSDPQVGGVMFGVVVDYGEPGSWYDEYSDRLIFGSLEPWIEGLGLEPPYCRYDFLLDGILSLFEPGSPFGFVVEVVAGNLKVG